MASVTFTDLVSVGSLYRPMTDIYPSAALSFDTMTATPQTMTSLGTVVWNNAMANNQFNLQGQNWVAVTPGTPSAGVKNIGDRSISGVSVGMNIDFEFIYTGDKIDIFFICSGAFDCQVYVEYEGKMCKLKAKPLSYSTAGNVVRSIKFVGDGSSTLEANKARRIRVVMSGAANFVQLNVENSALTYASPNRPLAIIDGDSYVESFHSFNTGSDESYYTGGPIDSFIEYTGFAAARVAQGGTGFFNNSLGTAVTTDAANSATNSTRWGSSGRKTAMQPFMNDMPLLYILHGTVNDGALSGGTAPMTARAKVVYQEAAALDPHGLVTVVHVGNEPYSVPGSGVVGYTSGGANDLNRQGHIAAVAQCARTYYVDPAVPTNPWWTGSGYDNSPTSDQQALITGHDQLHGNYRGFHNHGFRIAQKIAALPVPAVRAARLG
jgi:hypothetical protein